MAKVSFPTRPGRIDEADKQKIFEMGSRGVKVSTIAMRIERHPASVRWHLFKMGLVQPVKRHGMPTDKPNKAGRKGYTAEEDAFITRLRQTGHHFRDIAAAVTEKFGHPRTAHGVEVRLTMTATLEAAE